MTIIPTLLVKWAKFNVKFFSNFVQYLVLFSSCTTAGTKYSFSCLFPVTCINLYAVLRKMLDDQTNQAGLRRRVDAIKLVLEDPAEEWMMLDFEAAYSFEGVLIFIMLVVCTCAYMNRVPRLKQWFLSEKKGFLGVFYKASVIGTRLHIPVALTCALMAVYVLFLK